MNLEKSWEKYAAETEFNFSVISDSLKDHGTKLVFEPDATIISRGDFPQHIYFLIEGVAIGLRDYEDGRDYSYFQIDKTNGNIGLLEVLARKQTYIATITSVTKTTVIKVDAAIVYELIMSDASLLRRCAVLLAEDLYNRSGNDGIFYHFKGIDRVRYYLVRYYEMNQTAAETMPIREPYKGIADQIGVSVRTVGRSIKQLKYLNEISSSNRMLSMSNEQYKKMKQNIYQ